MMALHLIIQKYVESMYLIELAIKHTTDTVKYTACLDLQ